MFLGADQGPAVTLDGGATWTPWYTMPNGELYFVSTDERFPYRIYAPQQDSGTVSILSRSDFGAIRPNDWYPVSGYEEGHIFCTQIKPLRTAVILISSQPNLIMLVRFLCKLLHVPQLVWPLIRCR